MNKTPHICCFGEILWDVFPDRTFLGGAPLNVALRLKSLGSQALMIGAVGRDELGERAIETLRESNLNMLGIRQEDRFPTGTVQVELHQGIASYQIMEDAAWDHIKVTPKVLGKAEQSDALVFGSLAIRKPHNRQQLNKLLEVSSFAAFDLNLRDPFYVLQDIDDLMRISEMAKLNDEELIKMAGFLGLSETTPKEQARTLQQVYGLHAICITMGEKGALLWLSDSYYSHPGYPSSAIDTVGAGDSFLATFLHEYLSGTSPGRALDQACAMGALVAGKKGANCSVSLSEIAGLTGRGPHSN